MCDFYGLTLVGIITIEGKRVVAVQDGAILWCDSPPPTHRLEASSEQAYNWNDINAHKLLTCNTKSPPQLRQRRAGRPCKRSTWWQTWRPYRGWSREGAEEEGRVWGHRQLCSPDRSRDLNRPLSLLYRHRFCCSWACNQKPPHLEKQDHYLPFLGKK